MNYVCDQIVATVSRSCYVHCFFCSWHMACLNGETKHNLYMRYTTNLSIITHSN